VHPTLILDEMCRVVWANDHYYRVFQVTAVETLGNLMQFIGNGQWAVPRLRSLINQCLSSGLPFHDFVLTHDFEHIGHKTFRLSGSRNTGISQGERTVVLLIEE
jgi:two-component system CheB/CheR fusion protein